MRLLVWVLFCIGLCGRFSVALLPPPAGRGLLHSGESLSGATVTHTSAFQEVGNSFKWALAGLFLFLLGFPVLWFNERRQCIMWKLFGKAASICKPNIPSDRIDRSNEGNLVHIQGVTSNEHDLVDTTFKVPVKNCASLSRCLEMYQWVENSRTEEKDDNWGGKTQITTYSYGQEWRSDYVDSSRFAHPAGHINPPVLGGLRLGRSTETAKEVKLGSFELPRQLIAKLSRRQNCTIAGRFPKTVAGCSFVMQGGYATTSIAGAEVGDLRVSFEKVPCGAATVLAVQRRGTFAPMSADMPISNGKVGLAPFADFMDQKERKMGIDFDEEGGTCLCCAMCDCVGKVIESGEEVFEICEDSVSAKQVLNAAASKQNFQHYFLGFIGWLMIVGGMTMMLNVIPALFRFIPFVGTWIQFFGKFLVGAIALLLGTSLTFITIALAWLRMRPFKALFLVLLGVAVVAVPTYLSRSHHLHSA